MVELAALHDLGRSRNLRISPKIVWTFPGPPGTSIASGGRSWCWGEFVFLSALFYALPSRLFLLPPFET